jgi:hypothetical protein
MAASYFARVKTELLHRQPWPARQAVQSAIFEYVEGWYKSAPPFPAGLAQPGRLRNAAPAGGTDRLIDLSTIGG